MRKYTYLVHGRPRYRLADGNRVNLSSDAHGWRRCHSQMVWQAMVALAFAANMYQWGIDNGEDCIKPKHRPVNLMNCK